MQYIIKGLKVIPTLLVSIIIMIMGSCVFGTMLYIGFMSGIVPIILSIILVLLCISKAIKHKYQQYWQNNKSTISQKIFRFFDGFRYYLGELFLSFFGFAIFPIIVDLKWRGYWILSLMNKEACSYKEAKKLLREGKYIHSAYSLSKLNADGLYQECKCFGRLRSSDYTYNNDSYKSPNNISDSSSSSFYSPTSLDYITSPTYHNLPCNVFHNDM